MKSGQKGRREKRSGRAVRKRKVRVSLAAHKAFAPLLGLWGVLLGSLVVLVMPYPLVGGALQGTLLGSWGEAAQAVFALIAAALLGSAMFALGAWRHSQANPLKAKSVVGWAMRQVTPINPAQDLGSQRLDDPVDTMPFTTPAWRDADLVEPAAPPVRATEPQAEPAEAPEPVELDLAQFAELPNRNAVWVEEPAPAAAAAAEEAAPEAQPAPRAEPANDPVAEIRARHLRAVAPPPPMPGQAALARLRATPANELSLIEMVERFAGALHEHRESAPSHKPGPADLAAREAALAEALKALAALSGGTPAAPGRDGPAEPLRAALAQLQPRRGAA
jgi:hypothetical protein